MVTRAADDEEQHQKVAEHSPATVTSCSVIGAAVDGGVTILSECYRTDQSTNRGDAFTEFNDGIAGIARRTAVIG